MYRFPSFAVFCMACSLRRGGRSVSQLLRKNLSRADTQRRYEVGSDLAFPTKRRNKREDVNTFPRNMLRPTRAGSCLDIRQVGRLHYFSRVVFILRFECCTECRKHTRRGVVFSSVGLKHAFDTAGLPVASIAEFETRRG